MPAHASFPRAFIRNWREALNLNADYVFYLEDDWILNYYVDLPHLLNIFSRYPKLQILRFLPRPSSNIGTKIGRVSIPYNGDFFELHNSDIHSMGYGGNPSLIRRSFVSNTINYLTVLDDPEYLLKGHSTQTKQYMKDKLFGFFGYLDSPPLVSDIGRKWRAENHYDKIGLHGSFTNWSIRKGNSAP